MLDCDPNFANICGDDCRNPATGAGRRNPREGDMADYFVMGGYAAYVWPAYGVTVVMLAGMLVATLRGVRAREAMVRALEAARPSRAARRAARAEAAAATGAPATPATGDGPA